MPAFMKVSRWELLWILPILCAFFFVYGWSVFDFYYSSRRAGPFWDEYEQIQEGMTRKQVEEILGPADIGWQCTDSTLCDWFDGERTIAVHFCGGSVCKKKFVTPRDRLNEKSDDQLRKWR
jgi:hypothetical protein